MKRSHYFRMVHWKLMALSLGLSSLAYTTPSNPTAIQGTLAIENSDEQTYTITVSDDAYIFWDDFSIAEQERVEFYQPSSKSVAVIEVTTNMPSTLLGTLKSNGTLFLINSNGVMIGESAYIDSHGFLTSTLPACPCPLIDGEQDVFIQGNSKAQIVNRGRIKAWENDIYLIGYKIENKGVIDAPKGTVALAAGQEVILNQSNGQKVGTFPSPIKYENEETGIDNSGTISGARAELKADGNSYSIAIRHSGSIDIVGLAGQKGQVYLVTQKGDAIVSGAIAAENIDETGGEIQILGEHIFLFENSTIDACGDKGGGQVSIGMQEGELNPEIIAKMIFIDNGVLILADAIEEGDGGKVVIWSDETTCFLGAVSVCGGDNSGNGGIIEISGKKMLDSRGETDYSAPHGREGMLLFNPL